MYVVCTYNSSVYPHRTYTNANEKTRMCFMKPQTSKERQSKRELEKSNNSSIIRTTHILWAYRIVYILLSRAFRDGLWCHTLCGIVILHAICLVACCYVSYSLSYVQKKIDTLFSLWKVTKRLVIKNGWRKPDSGQTWVRKKQSLFSSAWCKKLSTITI